MALKKKTRRKITYTVLIAIFIICAFVIIDNLYKFTGSTVDKEELNNSNQEEITVDYRVNISIGLVNIDTFNPIITKNTDVVHFCDLIYNSLFEYNDNMELVNDLVDSYNYSDNDLYIKLKNNVYWHNGNKLNSYDVEFTINMIKQYGGIYADFVKNISEVNIIDDNTIKLSVISRGALSEYDLVFPIMSSKYYENEDFIKTDKNLKPMGTGMYKYKEGEGPQYLFTFNDKADFRAQIGNIIVYNYNSISEAFANVKNKKVDIVFTGLTNYDEYIGKIGYSKEEYIDNTYIFLAINKGNKYLNNVNVRKSINMAIDKENVFNEVYNGLGYVSQSIIYPHSYLYKNINENYDVDQAKQMLIDSNMNNKVSLNLLVNSSSEEDVQTAQIIKEQLEKVNVKVSIVSKSNADYRDSLKNYNYDLALVDFNITSNINMKMFDDGEFYNIFSFENVEFKNYLVNIKNLISYDERKELFYNIQEMILDNIPYIGIGFKINTVIYNTDILGVTNLRYNNLFINFPEFYKK